MKKNLLLAGMLLSSNLIAENRIGNYINEYFEFRDSQALPLPERIEKVSSLIKKVHNNAKKEEGDKQTNLYFLASDMFLKKLRWRAEDLGVKDGNFESLPELNIDSQKYFQLIEQLCLEKGHHTACTNLFYLNVSMPNTKIAGRLADSTKAKSFLSYGKGKLSGHYIGTMASAFEIGAMNTGSEEKNKKIEKELNNFSLTRDVTLIGSSGYFLLENDEDYKFLLDVLGEYHTGKDIEEQKLFIINNINTSNTNLMETLEKYWNSDQPQYREKLKNLYIEAMVGSFNLDHPWIWPVSHEDFAWKSVLENIVEQSEEIKLDLDARIIARIRKFASEHGISIEQVNSSQYDLIMRCRFSSAGVDEEVEKIIGGPLSDYFGTVRSSF